MTKLGTPPMPMGATFDPDASIVANARNAWEVERDRQRVRNEHNAKVLARRTFRRDDMAFLYHDAVPALGQTTPTFEIDGYLFAFKPDEGVFALVQFCETCGKEARYRLPFNSLATLGRAIETFEDEEDAFNCQECRVKAAIEDYAQTRFRKKS